MIFTSGVVVFAFLFVIALFAACATDKKSLPPGPFAEEIKIAPKNAVDRKEDSEWIERIFIGGLLLAIAVCAIEFIFNGTGHWGTEGWAAVFAGVLILVTLQQAYYARRQWHAMSDQTAHLQQEMLATQVAADAAKRSADAASYTVKQIQLEQRAWIHFPKVIIDPIEPGAHLRVVLEVKNSGKTPGFIDGERFVFVVKEPGVDIEAVARSHDKKPIDAPYCSALAPGETSTIIFTDDNTFNEVMAVSLNAGTMILIITIAIRYADAMNQVHRTGQTFIYNHVDRALQIVTKNNYLE